MCCSIFHEPPYWESCFHPDWVCIFVSVVSMKQWMALCPSLSIQPSLPYRLLWYVKNHTNIIGWCQLAYTACVKCYLCIKETTFLQLTWLFLELWWSAKCAFVIFCCPPLEVHYKQPENSTYNHQKKLSGLLIKSRTKFTHSWLWLFLANLRA